jgi:hypothetical protein
VVQLYKATEENKWKYTGTTGALSLHQLNPNTPATLSIVPTNVFDLSSERSSHTLKTVHHSKVTWEASITEISEYKCDAPFFHSFLYKVLYSLKLNWVINTDFVL